LQPLLQPVLPVEQPADHAQHGIGQMGIVQIRSCGRAPGLGNSSRHTNYGGSGRDGPNHLEAYADLGTFSQEVEVLNLGHHGQTLQPDAFDHKLLLPECILSIHEKYYFMFFILGQDSDKAKRTRLPGKRS
jgi:hypothetical protein